MKKALMVLLGALGLYGTTSNAGGVATGSIAALYVTQYGSTSNWATVSLANAYPYTGAPPCTNNAVFSFSLDNPGGRAMFKQLTLAMMMNNRSVSITGTGLCSDNPWGTRETANGVGMPTMQF